MEENISIKIALQELDKKIVNKDNNNPISESFEMNPLFQEMKKNFCIFCLNE